MNVIAFCTTLWLSYWQIVRHENTYISASAKDVYIGSVNNHLANIWDIVFPHGIPVDVNFVYLFRATYDYVIIF